MLRDQGMEILDPSARALLACAGAEVDGERVRSVALVGGGYELTSRDNLSVAEARLTDEPEPSAPSPEPSGPSCAGLLILITWGQCLSW